MPYVAPAMVGVASQIAKSAINSAFSSIDWSRAGRAASKAKEGYFSKKENPVSYKGFMDSSSSAPVTLSNRFVSRTAKIRRSSGRGPTVISHREMISGSIAGSTAFAIQSTLNINPGLAKSFPWLSTQASQYEEYRFTKLRYEYVPIAPTSTQGDILLVPDYDASNPPPTTEVQAIDHRDAVIDSVWKPVVLSLNPKDMYALGPRKYVRTANMYGDVKTFDSGIFYLCSNNETGTSTVGKLFVEYTVELFTPLNGPADGTVALSQSAFSLSANQSFTTATPAILAFDTTVVNGLNVVNTGGSLVPPAGFYRVDYAVTGADSSNGIVVFDITIEKNNAGLLSPNQGELTTLVPGSGSGETLALSGFGYVSCNGTDAITLIVTFTASVGTPQVISNKAIVSLQIV